MREIRLSSSEGGGADIRSPYPYFIDTAPLMVASSPSGAARALADLV